MNSKASATACTEHYSHLRSAHIAFVRACHLLTFRTLQLLHSRLYSLNVEAVDCSCRESIGERTLTLLGGDSQVSGGTSISLSVASLAKRTPRKRTRTENVGKTKHVPRQILWAQRLKFIPSPYCVRASKRKGICPFCFSFCFKLTQNSTCFVVSKTKH